MSPTILPPANSPPLLSSLIYTQQTQKSKVCTTRLAIIFAERHSVNTHMQQNRKKTETSVYHKYSCLLIIEQFETLFMNYEKKTEALTHSVAHHAHQKQISESNLPNSVPSTLFLSSALLEFKIQVQFISRGEMMLHSHHQHQ